MSDVIKLLSDAVANQIAAGEVVQRPASVVKELMENAVDSGAQNITLIIKDAGKSLIQIIDDGCGMSETDARMSFERHATSKIKKAEDIFQLQTKGFRGEALASIAAVAHVEMKTRLHKLDAGTAVINEGSKVTQHEAVATPQGTSIAVKNLFFNIPARRNFLKSDNVEYSHIVEEFFRVALTHPDIQFSFYNNNNLTFKLDKGTFKQRVVALFGSNYNEKLVPVEEETNVVNIIGFVGKPEAAKKTRGEQYFFVNNRFIKSPYLHHAVTSAYQQLLSSETHPSYFLMLEIDPARIDINIHPTKTEIKFEDEKVIYNILKAAIRKSLGQYNIAPSLDFEVENSFAIDFNANTRPIVEPTIKVNPEFNPFSNGGNKPNTGSTFISGNNFDKHRNAEKWESLYDIVNDNAENQVVQSAIDTNIEEVKTNFIQVNRTYILTTLSSGILLINQHAAHERVLFEEYVQKIANNKVATQQLLFPINVHLSPKDYDLVMSMEEAFKNIGFDLQNFGNQTIVINGVPTGLENENVETTIEEILENYKNTQNEASSNKLSALAKSLAKTAAIKKGRSLNLKEMQELVENLFACENSITSPSGEKITVKISVEELLKKFQS